MGKLVFTPAGRHLRVADTARAASRAWAARSEFALADAYRVVCEEHERLAALAIAVGAAVLPRDSRKASA